MRNALTLLGLLALGATFTSGCAGPQEKLGRGFRNTTEVVRLGELRASMEQTAVWDSPSDAATTGVVKGVTHSLARTGLGVYDIITFPFPPYHPIWTHYVTPEPVYPDNYFPELPDGPLYDSHPFIGYSGGTSFGFIPGSQFDTLGH